MDRKIERTFKAGDCNKIVPIYTSVYVFMYIEKCVCVRSINILC